VVDFERGAGVLPGRCRKDGLAVSGFVKRIDAIADFRVSGMHKCLHVRIALADALGKVAGVGRFEAARNQGEPIGLKDVLGNGAGKPPSPLKPAVAWRCRGKHRNQDP
jgi:hypothetical protein